MRLAEIKSGVSRPLGTKPKAAAEPSRALVALTPPAASQRDTGQNYRPALFLAHLIATQGQLPQTRERRRAEPAEAIAAYRTAATLTQ